MANKTKRKAKKVKNSPSSSTAPRSTGESPTAAQPTTESSSTSTDRAPPTEESPPMVVEAITHSAPNSQPNEPIDSKLREWTDGMSLGVNEYRFVKILFETNTSYKELKAVSEKKMAHDQKIISALEKENEKLKKSDADKDSFNKVLWARFKEVNDALKKQTSGAGAEKAVEEQASSLRAAHEVEMENLRTEHQAALSALEAEKEQQTTQLLGDVVRIAVSAHQEKGDMESAFMEEKEVLVAQTEEKLAGTRRLFFAIFLSFFTIGMLLFFGPACSKFLYDFVATNLSPIITPITSICSNIVRFAYDLFHQNDPPTSIRTLVSVSAFTRLEAIIAPTCYENISVAPDVAFEPVKSCGINILCWFAKGCGWLGFV